MMETAEDRLRYHTISAFRLMASQSRREGVGIRVGNARAESRVRATAIILTHPLGQDSPEVPLIERNTPIQTFTTCCPDHAFAISVRLRHPIGVLVREAPWRSGRGPPRSRRRYRDRAPRIDVRFLP